MIKVLLATSLVFLMGCDIGEITTIKTTKNTVRNGGDTWCFELTNSSKETTEVCIITRKIKEKK